MSVHLNLHILSTIRRYEVQDSPSYRLTFCQRSLEMELAVQAVICIHLSIAADQTGRVVTSAQNTVGTHKADHLQRLQGQFKWVKRTLLCVYTVIKTFTPTSK
ncbi:hypothetical protein ILYODFUR_018940 [Ilyodon furcidens]|uniref:Uncharacterized protein n=1 Tax=Ilyodon furcidens TaxID=33524 RepID=A0ABV0VF76_9TELE